MGYIINDEGQLVPEDEHTPALVSNVTEPVQEGQGETLAPTPEAGAGAGDTNDEAPGFIEEALRAVGGGVRDGAQELGETIQWAGESAGKAVTGGHDIYWTGGDGFKWLTDEEAADRTDIPEWQTRDLFGEEGTLSLPEVAPNETVVGGVARGITQFLAGYGAVGRTLKLAKAKTAAGVITQGMTKGAVTGLRCV